MSFVNRVLFKENLLFILTAVQRKRFNYRK